MEKNTTQGRVKECTHKGETKYLIKEWTDRMKTAEKADWGTILIVMLRFLTHRIKSISVQFYPFYSF